VLVLPSEETDDPKDEDEPPIIVEPTDTADDSNKLEAFIEEVTAEGELILGFNQEIQLMGWLNSSLELRMRNED